MNGLLSAFVPRRGAWAGPLLIDINVAVFVLMVVTGAGLLSFSPAALYVWGANYGPALHGIGWLRLLTSLFVHGGLLHLAMNMYGLFFSARLLEALIGSTRFLILYLLCGLAASFLSTAMHPENLSVGASGAIFGTFGMLLSLMLFGNERLRMLRRVLLGNVITLIALNLFIGASTPGIDNAAHIGGLLAGALLGALLGLASHRR